MTQVTSWACLIGEPVGIMQGNQKQSIHFLGLPHFEGHPALRAVVKSHWPRSYLFGGLCDPASGKGRGHRFLLTAFKGTCLSTFAWHMAGATYMNNGQYATISVLGVPGWFLLVILSLTRICVVRLVDSSWVDVANLRHGRVRPLSG